MRCAFWAGFGLVQRGDPGLALLRLAEGRLDAAVASIERALDDASDYVMRAQLLPAFVEIMLAAERTANARRASDELAELAAGTHTGLLDAVAAGARGTVLLAEGEPRAALEALHAACRSWHDMDAPYEAAQVRVLIAFACRAVGDPTPPISSATPPGLRSSGWGRDRRCGDSTSAGQSLVQGALPVTARELEVLRLVAAGKTNRETAEALSISERTVERHLGNIFTKLDVANRAAATAYAYDHGLV